MASSSAIQPREKYDVFISFRGTDTRQTFTSHLYDALIRMKIDAYIDYRLERGDEIRSALLKAIEGSKIFVIIFSQDYASSTWCLDELVHIMDCKDRYKRIVIPIFYNIDPAIVRHQTESYAEAFAKHKSRIIFREEKLVEWKDALKTAANLSGFDSTSTTVRNDSDLVEQVIKDILTKLDWGLSSDLSGLVGAESRIKQILLLLCNVPVGIGIRTVGIWGMGGAGKTTLANAVFHELSSQFEACCFLPNVRETSAPKGHFSPQLYNLRDTLLGELLGEGSVPKQRTETITKFVKARLQRTKVLVVLDDVDHWRQLEFLVGNQVPFGLGSRIIITTRDMSQLEAMKKLREGADHDVEIYKVEELNGDEACQLFHLKNDPRDICSEADSKEVVMKADSKEVLMKVMDYAAGNPLALKILSSLFFRFMGEKNLKDIWNKLKKFPDQDLQNVCRISYEALEENEREIFLDIVCFHKGNKIGVVKRELDACGLFSDIGTKTLIDMSLISNKDGRLWIHDVIQEFGWDIVRKECPKEPGKRTRLYTCEDITHVLGKATGTATVQSICLDSWPDIYLDTGTTEEIKKRTHPQAFTRMYNLIFLRVNHGRWSGRNEMEHFLGHESFPDSLRYLDWPRYPLKSLPSQYSPKNLVELHMLCSKLQRLWNEGQNPENLKRIDLRGSSELVEIPDLSKSKNIESIDLEGCESLVQVPSTIWSLNKLVELKLGQCGKLEFLTSLKLQETKRVNMPTSICKMKSLKELDLSGCSSFDCFPEILEPMERLEVLRLSETAIKQLPESIGNLVGLKILKLTRCKSLESVPQSIYKLNLLEELDLSCCFSFNYFPEISEPMEHLEVLRLIGTAIKQLPESIGNLVGLKVLNLTVCRSLESVPQSIHKLNLLEKLLAGCTELTKLPSSSIRLGENLEEIPYGLFSLTSLKSLDLSKSLIESIPPLVQLSELTSLDIYDCKRLQSLPEVPLLLEKLDAQGCTTLKTVSFSMTAITQGSDQIDRSFQADCVRKEEHTFFNCLDLHENARSNIMNDAQLRIMRMAAVLSKRKDINRELFEKYFRRCPVSVICPGNEIPKWFSYQTEGSSINIYLPPNWSDENFLGFALCAVGTISGLSTYLLFQCRYNFKFNNGQCQGYEVDLSQIWPHIWEVALSPDHVFVWYHPFIFNDTEWCTEASFEFWAVEMTPDPEISGSVKLFNVNRCGVGLLYAQGQDSVAVKQRDPV